MQYVLQPTEDDVLHSAKGTTWKTHKYVEIVNTNGKRRYVYKDKTQSRRDKISAEYKRNNAKNNGQKAQYNRELELAEINRQLADINRPLSAKIQKAFLNTYANAYSLMEKSGLLDKKLEKARLADEKAKLEAMISATNFRKSQEIRNDIDAKKGQEILKYMKDKQEKSLYDLQNKINEDLEEKRKKREKEQERENRASNFRNRILLKKNGGK